MTHPAKTAASISAAPVKTRTRKPAKAALAAPATAPVEKPPKAAAVKPATTARSKKAAAETIPSKPVTRARVRRKPAINAEQRRRHIELAAYFMAEQHGFTPGREHEDWVAAEAEIDRMLDKGVLMP